MSSSAEKPFLNIPPSFIAIGGSSTIASSNITKRSSKTSNFPFISLNRSLSSSVRRFFISGKYWIEFLKASISLGFAVFKDILVIRRSRSYIEFKYSLNSSLVISALFNALILSCRLVISVISSNGCSIYSLSFLAPIAVFVLSRTHNKDPFFCLSLIVSVSSRFRLVDESIIIYESTEYISILLICSNDCICVSYKYCNKAPHAFTDSGKSLSPKPSIFLRLKCFCNTSIQLI